MKNVAVLTATRAEYGLLAPIIKKLQKCEDFRVHVLVTGMHLSPEFGMTYKEIVEDGINIDKKIEILLSSDTPAAISKSMGLAMMGFADYFAEQPLDALIVLGDRYESLAVCCAAMNAKIPIFHLHGGESTEGAIDEVIRHSITKMSYLHFTSTEVFRNRVIQLGEAPERVYCVGAMGIENALHMDLMSREKLEDSIGYKLGDCYAVGTFHPVTLETATAEEQVIELLKALEKNKNVSYLFTRANADAYGRIINGLLEEYSNTHSNFILVDSLGRKRYLSALKYAAFVIGNSSSGLIEAPTFKIPTINIGERQKGRLFASSVIQCQPQESDIDRAIKRALSNEFREQASRTKNPYGDGETSDKIINIVREYLLSDRINIKKSFYDVPSLLDRDGI